MKEKIVILSNTVGVIYKFKFELLEKLIEKYDVYLIAQNENEDIFLEKIKKLGVKFLNMPISRRGINPFEDLKLCVKYLKELRRISPQFVYTFTIKPNIYGGLIIRVLNIKYATTITGIGTVFQKEKLTTKLVKLLYRKALKKSSGVFFENVENKEFFINKKLIKKEQAILVPGSGVNIEKFSPQKKSIKNKNKVFLFIGRIMKEKGIEEFLYTAKKIKEKNQNVEFWILGNYEEESYKQEIGRLNRQGIVKYLGVSNDVREIIREVDFIIQPSYHEGMSNVILEASAMGKLVIASNINGCKEAILNKQFLFEKENKDSLLLKIEEIIKIKKEKIKKEVKNQRAFILKNFSRTKVIELQMRIKEKI